ncbi:MAG: SBBP repeat-containing protein [candidate division Zixibacteria bacterium]|nr:SBBP repeat-containing protein [candidate division Zixibacteria bacterium]
MPRLTKSVLGFITAILCGSLFAANTQPTIQSFKKMPLSFTKNMGQWDEHVLFRANAGGATMWLTKEGVTYQFTRRIATRSGAVSAPGVSVGRTFLSDPGQAGMPILPGDRYEKDSIEQLVLTAKFVGANPNPEIVGQGQMEYKCNYFLGNDPSKWHTDVPNYEAITLKEIYPGIDLKYYGNGDGKIEYDFIIRACTDPSQIAIHYDGATEVCVDDEGRLVVETEWGKVTERAPLVYQVPNGKLREIEAQYSLREKYTFGFMLSEEYEPEYAAVIDPVLSYSTYLGGSNDYDVGYGIAVGLGGFAYVTGRTASTDFPIQTPYQSDQGWDDVFLTKFSAMGNSLVYSSYLGGNGPESGTGIAVDSTGSAYVTGWEDSNNFPIHNSSQTDLGRSGVFVTKLSPLGNSLIYSTCFGGSMDDQALGIAVDGNGCAYVAGVTWSTDFPICNPYQWSNNGGYYFPVDAFATKLSASGNSLVYSTYLGGTNDDVGYGIAIDDSGCAYVAGGTRSTDFPTKNPYQGTCQECNLYSYDAFVAKLGSSGDSLVYSTYLGGNNDDNAFAIAVDVGGFAYVTGRCGIFPTQNSYQGTYQGGGYDAYVTKLNAFGDSLIYSTYLGGGGIDYGYGIAVDGSGCAYVTGETSSSNFPILNPGQTSQGNKDGFVTRLSAIGNSLVYSTCLGGSGDDGGCGIAVDGSGSAYVTGWTQSSNFPTLNPYQAMLRGDGDAFVTKLNDSHFCQEFAGLFCDDFDDMLNPLWSQTEGSCVWLATGGVFQTSLVGMQLSCVQSVGDTTWRNYSFEADVRGNDGTDKVLRFRQRDANTRYWVNLRSDWQGQDELLLGKQAGGIETILQTVPHVSQNGVWYHLKVTCVGSHIRVSVNGNETIVFDDVIDPIRSGGIGLVCFTGGFGSCDISFDNVRVINIEYGDADASGGVDISDAVYSISYIFSGGPAPSPVEAGDANCDQAVDISDAVYLIAYIFSGGPAPCSAF